ncbi:MAG TPA: NAD-dependent epimerase/dehydratase family protein [Candidatus Paceibacterota bacterium]|nr:NAD-dependent epimerase/dehydratase family protein [Candidatus Paceibacterota bacterium]
MASILVTGGAGFIGSNLCKSLLDEGHIVHCVDNLVTGNRNNVAALSQHDNFIFYEFDIANPALAQLFPTRLDYIYHLACPTGVPNLTRLATEMLHACSYGMFNVLELAKQHEAKMVFTSTAEIYGQPERTPQDEDYTGNVHPMGIRSAYEEGKRFSESCLAAYVRYHGLDARVVRVFNTYGPGMSLSDRRVIPQFISSVLRKEPLRVYGDGSQTRTHLYVDDLVRGIRLVMDKGLPGEAYNIGSEHPMTVRELAELVIELTSHDEGIEYVPHFIEDHRHRKPSIEKAKQLGWQQEVEITIGLQKMIGLHIETVSSVVAQASDERTREEVLEDAPAIKLAPVV